MSTYHHHNFDFNITPPLKEATRFSVRMTSTPLLQAGFNLPVEISTASAFRKPPLNYPLSSVVVMAHFDTGASITSIDIDLARHLGLLVTGESESMTAAGK